MSHFTVMVIGEDPEDQLAPYEESPDNESGFLVFEDMTDEYKREYETKGVERVVMPDGTYKATWDESFRNPEIFGSPQYIIPEGLERKEVPFKELYSTFEDFAVDWYGSKNVNHRYGYYHNPNAKWDWYELGGRWTGYFKVIPDPVLDIVGTPGVFNNEAKEGYADQVYKGDIDTTLEEVRVPFAIVVNGQWYEKGRMGWWAMVSDEKDKDEWDREFHEMFDALPDDTLVSLYDCHI